MCKAYLLCKRAKEYEGMPNADRIIDNICKDYKHNYEMMLKEVFVSKYQTIIEEEYDGYKGQDLVQLLPKIFQESRYIVPETEESKVLKNGVPFLPIMSSGFPKFCYKIGNKIRALLQSDYSINIDDDKIVKHLSKKIDCNAEIKSEIIENEQTVQQRFLNIFNA